MRVRYETQFQVWVNGRIFDTWQVRCSAEQDARDLQGEVVEVLVEVVLPCDMQSALKRG